MDIKYLKELTDEVIGTIDTNFIDTDDVNKMRDLCNRVCCDCETVYITVVTDVVDTKV